MIWTITELARLLVSSHSNMVSWSDPASVPCHAASHWPYLAAEQPLAITEHLPTLPGGQQSASPGWGMAELHLFAGFDNWDILQKNPESSGDTLIKQLEWLLCSTFPDFSWLAALLDHFSLSSILIISGTWAATLKSVVQKKSLLFAGFLSLHIVKGQKSVSTEGERLPLNCLLTLSVPLKHRGDMKNQVQNF